MSAANNVAVLRRLAGYGRLSGLAAAAALQRLYGSARLYVNFFQPSFKLASKQRDGALGKLCTSSSIRVQRKRWIDKGGGG